MSIIVQFREINRARKEDSDEVVIYEGVADNAVFAYVYLNSSAYTLVWTGHQDYQFDVRQPYSFIEYQFSYFPPSAIARLDVVLPKRIPHSEATARMQHYHFNKATVNLILASELNQTLVEYDLLNNARHQIEYVENLSQPEYVSRISFARYDSEIETKTGRYNCCFTLEKPRRAGTQGWEFAINVPRTLELRERTLIWVARNHHAEGLMHHLDFKKSQDALREILNPRTESVFS